MGRKEIAGFRSASRRSVVFITNDAPPRFICPLGNSPTCISEARRCSGHDDRQLNRPEAIDRSGYWDCTLARKQHPGGTATRNIAYHRHFRFADDSSHSRALSQVRLFDRGFADTPFSYQQFSSSPEHWRTSEEKTILAAVSFEVSLPGRCCSGVLVCPKRGQSPRLRCARESAYPLISDMSAAVRFVAMCQKLP